MRPAGLDWVSSLRAPQMAALAHEKGPFQPSLFDERNLLEVTSEAFPGERLIVCRNPLLAEERTRKREALLQATEAELMKIAEATSRVRNRLKGTEAIALRVGRVIDHFKMAKHFELSITDSSFTGAQGRADPQEAALDGLYVVRTSLPAAALSAEAAVTAYKGLGGRGARLPFAQDGRSAGAPRVPLERRTRARSCLSVHARLLRRVAHAREAKADAV